MRQAVWHECGSVPRGSPEPDFLFGLKQFGRASGAMVDPAFVGNQQGWHDKPQGLGPPPGRRKGRIPLSSRNMVGYLAGDSSFRRSNMVMMDGCLPPPPAHTSTPRRSEPLSPAEVYRQQKQEQDAMWTAGQ